MQHQKQQLQEEEELQGKIDSFESQLQERLRPDLEQLMSYREGLYEQVSNYLNLKNKITLIEEKQLKSMETMINLGSDFYVQANVPDTSKVIVNVALGIHVEFSLAEALEFIEKKEKHLNRYVDEASKQIYELSMRIRLIEELLARFRETQLEEARKKRK